MKHLRLRKDSLKVINASLYDTQWVKTGPKNQLLKMKLALEKALKPEKSKPTKGRKKSKNADEESEDLDKSFEELEQELLDVLGPDPSEQKEESKAPIAENFKKIYLGCIRVENQLPRMV
jgi:hypothetical protein